MKFPKLFLIAAIGLIVSTQAKAQLPEGFKAEVEVQAIGTTNKVVPFWMRSNQFGSIPLTGGSGSLQGRLYKSYIGLPPNDILYGREKTFDWAFGLDVRGNGGNKSNLQLIEAYGKIKIWKFQLKGGRSKDVIGLVGDSSLTSGNFSQSGNALGVPKLEISIPEFLEIPFLEGIFSFKGNFSHGWAGTKDVRKNISAVITSPVDRVPVYLHQKSFYGRFGKKDWKFKLYGGFNHQVFWGSEQKIYGKYFDLSPSQTFFYVATGKAYGNGSEIPNSKIGNHLGSIDLGAEYSFKDFRMIVYRQAFYEVGALSKLANIVDGLNGISIKNLNPKDGGFSLNSLVLEFLYTKNQAGELDSRYTKSGDEDYYNNYFYTEGWSYKGLGLGNPLLSTKSSTRNGLASDPNDYFINNRVIAYHIGVGGSINAWTFQSKISYSQNFGTFGTSPIGHSLGRERFPPKFGIFQQVNQFSFYFDNQKEIKDGLIIGYTVGYDQGGLLRNSVGVAFKVRKSI